MERGSSSTIYKGEKTSINNNKYKWFSYCVYHIKSIATKLENFFNFIQEWDDAKIEFVKHGDLIRLEHILTRRNVHTHQEPAPLSKKQFQVRIFHDQ